jgi:hypothetical protein
MQIVGYVYPISQKNISAEYHPPYRANVVEIADGTPFTNYQFRFMLIDFCRKEPRVPLDNSVPADGDVLMAVHPQWLQHLGAKFVFFVPEAVDQIQKGYSRHPKYFLPAYLLHCRFSTMTPRI